MICEGDRARPLATEELLTRREWREEDEDEEEEEEDFEVGAGGAAGLAAEADLGISRTFSLRPVVGSLMDSRAGS